MSQPRSEGRGIPSGRAHTLLPSHDPRSKTIGCLHRGFEEFESHRFANYRGAVRHTCERNFFSNCIRVSSLLPANP